MALKRARQGSTTADAGKDEGAEHVVCKVVGTSATVHSDNEADNEAGKTDSYYEWKKTANGFKRRIIGAQGWTVCLFSFKVSPRTFGSLPGAYFSV